MNRFQKALSDVCGSHLFTEKWLLAPSLRIGQQWLDSLTFAGLPVLNVNIKTIKGMAIAMAAGEFALQKASILSAQRSLAVIDRLLQALDIERPGYFSRIPPGLARSESVARAITTIRLAGVEPDHIDPSYFEAPEKGADLKWLTIEYSRTLKERNLLDYSDVLGLLTEGLSAGTIGLSPSETMILVPADLDLNVLERRFLSLLPAKNLVTLPVDEHDGKCTEGPVNNAYLLRWVLDPSRAPMPKDDDSARIFRSIGECNEVREALRRCTTPGMRLDRVELLYTDTETYVPLIYESMVRSNADVGISNLPLTSEEGIPAMYSRPGKALPAWIEWVTEGFDRTGLVRMIKDGFLDIPGDPGEEGFHNFLVMLNKSGRESSAFKLLENLQDRIRLIDSAAADESELVNEIDEIAGYMDLLESESLRIMRNVVLFLERLHAVSVWQDRSQKEILDCMATFVEKCVRCENELDNYARLALLDEIRELSDCAAMDSRPLSIDVRAWAGSLASRIRIMGSGPRPGCLHIAHVMSGGHSGRTHTIIVGMDDVRFPGAVMDDPFLLDGEREKLSPDLPQIADRLRAKSVVIERLFARLRGTVTLGFSCADILEDRPMFPSSIVFSAYRILSGNRLSDQNEMMSWIGPPSSFASPNPDSSLDETEWWLSMLCGRNAVDLKRILEDNFPSLGQGLRAIEQRSGSCFTIYDGKLPDPAPDLDPTHYAGPIMSANKLETIAKCPLAYFFRYILGAKKPDEQGRDPSTWLGPLEFGSLLHDVFYRFMGELIEDGRAPAFERDKGTLLKILETHIDQYKELYPPGGPSVLARQERLLKQAALIFLTEEEMLCRERRPRFLEVTVGMSSDREKGLLDQVDPVSVKLPSGFSIRTQGRIDRVDQAGDLDLTSFVVWDYKTGRKDRHENTDPFFQGRILQHGLYIEIASQILRKKVSEDATVDAFGYFFPGWASRGARIMRLPSLRDSALSLIEKLCSISASGCFIATNNFEKDCRYCDFQIVCGDPVLISQAAHQKIKDPANTDLQAFRELRGLT